MNDETLKVVLPIASLIFGAFLGIGVSFVMIWWNTRRLKSALLSELEVLHETLVQQLLGYLRSLQWYAIGGVEAGAPLKITHPIYEFHYKDVCHRLSQSQRRSYELIHEHINQHNEDLNELRSFASGYLRDGPENLREQWGLKVQSQYMNLRTIEWHIIYHLNNKHDPELGIGTKTHLEYLKYREQIVRETLKVIEKSKRLKPEDLAKRYDPRSFAHLDEDSADDAT